MELLFFHLYDPGVLKFIFPGGNLVAESQKQYTIDVK